MSRRAAPAVSAADFLPERKTLASLRQAACDCRGCELYRHATQTVFGEGSPHARLILIGEQPGDREDIEGHPFVGPAGRLLDELLVAAGIDRDQVYVTNAVKHFKWTLRGKRRLHKKPGSREIAACRPWLSSEIEVIRPQGLICLGATAAQALLGPTFRITRRRGEIMKSDQANWIMATYHPSAVLRAPDEESRRQMREELVGDLKSAAAALV
ncbi:MAG TPA: UdgX family uracil-DNA binding protein [Pirellulales bacterium]|nr:UdgX family uracil-DNA binding protein [Pirellulales bacterium]